MTNATPTSDQPGLPYEFKGRYTSGCKFAVYPGACIQAFALDGTFLGSIVSLPHTEAAEAVRFQAKEASLLTGSHLADISYLMNGIQQRLEMGLEPFPGKNAK